MYKSKEFLKFAGGYPFSRNKKIYPMILQDKPSGPNFLYCIVLARQEVFQPVSGFLQIASFLLYLCFIFLIVL